MRFDYLVLYFFYFQFSILGQGSSYQCPTSTEIAIASCTDFSWVSDLPINKETHACLKETFINYWKLPSDNLSEWTNGSYHDFINWIDSLSLQKTNPLPIKKTLLFYFSSHQLKNGEIKFSKGPNLSPEILEKKIVQISKNYQQILWIHDCCYAETLESHITFPSNIIRLYSSLNNELTYDFYFEKGPFGLENFLKKERLWVQGLLTKSPQGLSFLGILSLKSAFSFNEKKPEVIDLQTWFQKMNYFREIYDKEIRQAKVPRLKLFPSDANLVLLEKRPPE